MEVVIVSEEEVHVTVVSPHNADLKKHVVSNPFSSEIAELQIDRKKFEDEKSIETSNPKFYLKAYPSQKQSNISTEVNDDSKGAQLRTIGIPVDSTFSKSQLCEKQEAKPDGEFGQCADTCKASTTHDMEENKVQTEDIQTSGNGTDDKVEVVLNLHKGITVGERIVEKNELSASMPEHGEISANDQSEYVIVFEDGTPVDQSSNADLINAICEQIAAVDKRGKYPLVTSPETYVVDQSSTLVNAHENTTCVETSVTAQPTNFVKANENAAFEKTSAVVESKNLSDLENTSSKDISAIEQSQDIDKTKVDTEISDIKSGESRNLTDFKNTSSKDISVIDQSQDVDKTKDSKESSDIKSIEFRNLSDLENTSAKDISAIDQSQDVDKTKAGEKSSDIKSVILGDPKHPRKRYIYKGYKKRQSPRNKRTKMESKDDILEENGISEAKIPSKVEKMECDNTTHDEVKTESVKVENDEANLNAVESNSEAQEKLRCHTCNRNFVSKRCLERHLTTQRHIDKEKLGGKQRRFKCDVCFKDFNRNSALQLHKMIHTDERPFQCNICKQRFKQKTVMNQHVLIHSGEKPFKCQVCEKVFRREYELKDHTLVHTGEKPFECSVCKKRFLRKRNLDNHEKLHTNDRSFICEICGKGFTCMNNLKTHIKIHKQGKSHLCNVCGKGFNQKHQLERHSMIHSNTKPFICEICGFQTADPDTLRCHTRRHTGEKPYSCKLCDRKFRKKNTLDRHQLIHERGPKKRGRKFSNVIKVYPCSVCGKTFAKNSRLTRHMKTHERKIHLQQASEMFIEQIQVNSDEFPNDVTDIIVLTV